MNNTKRIMVKILTILTLVIGTVTILQTNAKIIKTSGKLLVLHDNAAYYNEQYRNTDEMTEEYLADNAERQKIYNSEDTVVRVFSDSPTIIKMVVLVLALASFLLIPYMWFTLIIRELKRLAYKSRKSRKVIPMKKKRKLV